MKKAMMIVVSSIILLGLVGCGPSLEESFQEVQENAPGMCKDWCELNLECTFDDTNWDGDQDLEDGLFDYNVKACVITCSYLISEGTYVIEEMGDGDVEIIDEISGSLFQDVQECIYDLELWECDRYPGNTEIHHYYLDVSNDGDCKALNDCVDKFDVQFECEWSDSSTRCNCHGDQEIEGLHLPLP